MCRNISYIMGRVRHEQRVQSRENTTQGTMGKQPRLDGGVLCRIYVEQNALFEAIDTIGHYKCLFHMFVSCTDLRMVLWQKNRSPVHGWACEKLAVMSRRRSVPCLNTEIKISTIPCGYLPRKTRFPVNYYVAAKRD